MDVNLGSNRIIRKMFLNTWWTREKGAKRKKQRWQSRERNGKDCTSSFEYRRGGGGGRREPFGMVVFDYFCLDPCS